MTTTVGDVLSGKAKSAKVSPHCYIYVVRDGDTVFYVGQTKRGIINRILEHCGGGQIPDFSSLGRLILENAPESHHWQVEMLTLEDCGLLGKGDLDTMIDAAEERTIRQFRPCLNVANNPEPGALPPDYERIEEHRHWQAMADKLGV